MSLSINTSDDAAKVLVEGEVDVSNADQLRSAVDAALAGSAPEVTIDLAQVPYIDSTGIGVLVGAATARRRPASSSSSRAPRRTWRACSACSASPTTSTSGSRRRDPYQCLASEKQSSYSSCSSRS